MIGQTISHYQVSQKIGQGGMGEVYRARDVKLNRDVALKVLPEGFASDAARMRRFMREAQLLAALSHPNIAVLHALEESGGEHVLVMELVEGETLAELLERGPLPVAEALRLAAQIADGLQAAHKKGITHRDLKPANIKVTPDGVVKVLDFGLAKQRAGGGGVDTEAPTQQVEALTVRGVILGTPAYMSPEQALGEQTDARCDIFSFGAVLYEMLTGKRAFSGSTITTILRAVLSESPDAPRRLRPDIPAELDALVMRALQKEKELRQPSMEQVCSDLSRLSAKYNSESARPARPAVRRLSNAVWRARMWAAGNRKGALAAAALPVAVALGVGGFAVYRRAGAPAASATVAGGPAAPAANASPYELFRQGFVYLERYDREENIEAASQAFQAALSKDQNYAPAHAGLGAAYLARYQHNRDKQLLETALQNAKQAVDRDAHVAVGRVILGRVYVERGEYEAAAAELREALTLDPQDAAAYRGLGDLQRARKNWAEAESHYNKAIELRPNDWDLRLALGTFYIRASRYAEAEKAFAETVRLAPDNHIGYRNLGAVYLMQSRFADASAQFQTALQIKPTSGTYSNLGTSLFSQGLYQQSVAAMEQAVKLGANNYQTWANLGDAYRWTPGYKAKAGEAYRSAIQMVRNDLSAKPADAELRSRLALYLAKSGEQQPALDAAAGVEGLDQSASVLARLVTVYEICGRRQGALGAMRAALKAGHPIAEFRRDPELLELRKDPGYHKLTAEISDEPRN